MAATASDLKGSMDVASQEREADGESAATEKQAVASASATSKGKESAVEYISASLLATGSEGKNIDARGAQIIGKQVNYYSENPLAPVTESEFKAIPQALRHYYEVYCGDLDRGDNKKGISILKSYINLSIIEARETEEEKKLLDKKDMMTSTTTSEKETPPSGVRDKLL